MKKWEVEFCVFLKRKSLIFESFASTMLFYFSSDPGSVVLFFPHFCVCARVNSDVKTQKRATVSIRRVAQCYSVSHFLLRATCFKFKSPGRGISST